MCGIIAYKGAMDAAGIVVEGLKTLEYRGYDSWGIAAKVDGGLRLVRRTGKIEHVNAADLGIRSGMCIGHTRWATTGAVSERNAHPHLSMDGKVAVVHNGIIENYQKIRQNLIRQGYRFSSETDTEVIAQLIQYHMGLGKSFEEAFRLTLLEVEGSFAVVAIGKESDKMMFGRRGSPLCIGLDEGECFIASDVPAFLAHTRNVVYLDDDEYGEVDGTFRVFDLCSGRPVDKEQVMVSWDLEQAKKGDYPHYMLKEIFEQKRTIEKAMMQSSELVGKVSTMINEAFGIFFVGCGTSYHACVSASYVFSEVARKHVNVVLASEFANYQDFLTDKTLMVAVSQSGETADLLEAVKAAKKKGVKVISISNVMGSTLTRISDVNVMMHAGPEVCVLSTKSYTSQLAILLLLAYSCAGRAEEGRRLVRQASLLVPDIIERNMEPLRELAISLSKSKDMFLIGRDLAYPSALEGALKVKEVSYIHAEGFAGGELKHGTIALIEPGIPTIVLATDRTRQLILSNAAEIKARGGMIIGIDSMDNEVYDHLIRVQDISYANPILMIIPIQILAYHLAVARGCDPDKPRNLAKSVTVK